MDGQNFPVINSPLADCALWAVRDLAAKFRQPYVSSSEIVDQIGLAARALRAYQAELNGKVPADFLPLAIASGTAPQLVDSSIEQLLVSMTLVATADRDDSCPADESAISRRLGDWLAGACLRLSDRWRP